MTPTPTSDTAPILQNGRLMPGIYKIQNLHSKTFLDIHKHSKKLCCRPALDLEDGGLVRLPLPSTARTSDYYKWEIKSFGGGHTVQKASGAIRSIAVLDRMLRNVR